MLVAKKEDDPGSAASELRQEFQSEVHAFAVDLRDIDGPRRVFDWCLENNYRINILVNNAGLAGTADFQESGPGYSDDRILVNVRALVLLTQLFLPELKSHHRAYILNIGSMSAYYPLAYKTVYSASKVFVLYFSRALRQELRGSNVSVTVVNPNGVRTNTSTHVRIDSHSRLARKFFILEAERIARISIDSLLKGRLVVVPGFANRVLLALTRMLPIGFKERNSARIFKRELLAE